MPAPVASGWSGWPGGACTRWKMRRLFTAHGESGRSTKQYRSPQGHGRKPATARRIVDTNQTISASKARALRTSRAVLPALDYSRGSAPAARGDRRVRTRPRARAGEVDRSAQFEHTRLLAPGDFHGLEETGLGPRPVWLPALEGDLTTNAMQFRKPEPLAGLLDEGEASLAAQFRLQSHRPPSPRLRQVERYEPSPPAPARRTGDGRRSRRAIADDIFLPWFAHRAGGSMVDAAHRR